MIGSESRSGRGFQCVETLAMTSKNPMQLDERKEYCLPKLDTQTSRQVIEWVKTNPSAASDLYVVCICVRFSCRPIDALPKAKKIHSHSFGRVLILLPQDAVA